MKRRENWLTSATFTDLYFVTMNKLWCRCGPWQQREHVPDVSGSCLSHVWPGACPQSAHAADTAAPSPFVKSHFC